VCASVSVRVCVLECVSVRVCVLECVSVQKMNKTVFTLIICFTIIS